MRAVRLTAVGQDPEVTTVAVPEPGAGEVRVAMRACGICGSDLHVIEGSTVASFLPITLGHEPAGIVDALGPDVEGVTVGQRVAGNPMLGCGTCPACRRGLPNLCVDFRVIGVNADGAQAEYFILPAANLLSIPDNVDFATAAIITDAVATPMRAIRRSGVEPGQTAAVFGLGGLGTHAVLLLREVFGVRVIAVDTRPAALARASRFGAEAVVDARAGRTSEEVRRLSDGGVDAAFEFVGSAQVVDQSLRSLRPGGCCVVVGVTPDRLQLSLRQETLVAREISLVGSFGYLQSDLIELLALVEAGRLDLSETITHQFPLEDYRAGLDALRDPDQGAIRVVITND